MGDLSADESSALAEMTIFASHVQVWDVRLNDLEEIRAFEELLNELAEVERLSREKDNGQVRPGMTENDLDEAEASIFAFMNSENYAIGVWNHQNLPESEQATSELLTHREIYDRLLALGRCGYETNIFKPEEITFEAQDAGVNARLRFRRQDGGYIHEIALMD